MLSGRDDDQNGTLDTLLINGMSLDAANSIYASGIELARQEGKYSQQHGAGVFEYSIAGLSYVIHSFDLDTEEAYNTFVYTDADGSEIVGLDEDADGVLDRFKKGTGDLESTQQLYAIALREGMREGRIAVERGRYLVYTLP